MDDRPSFRKIYMKLALMMAERSTCKRLHVGCVITTIDYRQVLAVGYNGNAKGFPNTCDSEEPGACGCLHAEDNAVINCVAPRDQPKVVFVTHNPCVTCSKRLVNLGGVHGVFYESPYRSEAGLQVLEKAGISANQYPVTL